MSQQILTVIIITINAFLELKPAITASIWSMLSVVYPATVSHCSQRSGVCAHAKCISSISVCWLAQWRKAKRARTASFRCLFSVSFLDPLSVIRHLMAIK